MSYDPDNPWEEAPAVRALRMSVQELVSQVKELQSHDHKREAELIALRETLETHGWFPKHKGTP